MSALTAKRLKELRLKTNLSMNKFSKACGLTLAAWSLYESGQRLPRVETCYRIIDFMRMYGVNLTIEWLRPE